jgi:hypothetical protein
VPERRVPKEAGIDEIAFGNGISTGSWSAISFVADRFGLAGRTARRQDGRVLCLARAEEEFPASRSQRLLPQTGNTRSHVADRPRAARWYAIVPRCIHRSGVRCRAINCSLDCEQELCRQLRLQRVRAGEVINNDIPRGKFCQEVTELVRGTESDLLLNHSNRVYCLGRSPA